MISATQDLRPVPNLIEKVQDLFAEGVYALEGLGREEAISSVEQMMEALLSLNRSQIYLNRDRLVSSEQASQFRSWVERRKKREPLAYILGHAFFWNEKLEVKSCLVPRPETEILVAVAVEKIKSKQEQISFIDLGTGTGAITISLLRECANTRATLVDISSEVLQTAEKNLKAYQLLDRAEVIHSDLFQKIARDRVYDLIVSNPPYLSEKDLNEMEPELRYEPVSALDGGKDGFDFYRRIIRESKTRLKSDGWLLMELGIHQAEAVQKMLVEEKDYQKIEIKKDHLGIDRVIAAQKRN